MPNQNTTLTTSEKQSPRALEGASKMIDGAHEIASAATSAAGDKARQVRDQVDSGASAAESKASSLAREAGAAAKQATDRVESAARGVVSGAKEALSDVRHEASALLHDAHDVAVDSYDSARGYALDVAHDASALAQHASERTADYVRRASTATGRFATVHALPLAAVGASLGWLAWSMRSHSRRRAPEFAPPTPRLRATLAARRPPIQDDARELRTSRGASTTSGAKLMGVRSPDVRYEY